MRQSSEIGSDTLDWTRPTCTHELISKQNAKHSSRSIRRPNPLNRRGGSTIRSYSRWLGSRNRGSADRPSSPSSSEGNRDFNAAPGWSAPSLRVARSGIGPPQPVCSQCSPGRNHRRRAPGRRFRPSRPPQNSTVDICPDCCFGECLRKSVLAFGSCPPRTRIHSHFQRYITSLACGSGFGCGLG